jgi:hypothetical protein
VCNLQQLLSGFIAAGRIIGLSALLFAMLRKTIGEFFYFYTENSSSRSMKTHFSLIFLSLILFITTGAIAQRRHYFFYGKVTSQTTNAPLPEVNITFEGKKTGTTTDNKGEFSFYIDTIPVIMHVSHVGYETRHVLVDLTSYSLSIRLQPATKTLPEVVISGKTRYEPFFREARYAVLDYEISNDTVFILVYQYYLSQSELICKNLNGDTIAQSGRLSFVPKKLFRDCLGYVHVLSSDSAYQVYTMGGKAELVYAVSVNRFNEVLGDCVLSTPDLFFFKKSSDNGLGLDFYSIDRKTLRKQMVSSIKDSIKELMSRRNPDDMALLRSKKIPDSRDDFVRWSFIHKIQYRPISSEMFRIGNYLCIFNNTDGTIEFYLPDGTYSMKLKMKLEEVPDARWTKEILTDDAKEKAYTLFIRNGMCTLYRIDLNTGQLFRTLQISHEFPQKVRV